MDWKETMSIFEAGMLICFGAAWPTNIAKSLKSRTTKGKSLSFLVIIFVGYIFGILNKVLFHPDIVLMFYLINMLMVGADIWIWFHNLKMDHAST
jgi:hypothetical protein